MAESTDNAGVVFHPPILLLVLLIGGFVARAQWPLMWLSPEVARWSGPVLFVMSLALFGWTVVTMRRRGASIPTNTGTDVIVASGPFEYSRNPIYVSMVLLLISMSAWANTIWFLVCAAVHAVALNYGVIVREERYLERKFGDVYMNYKGGVRRWI